MNCKVIFLPFIIALLLHASIAETSKEREEKQESAIERILSEVKGVNSKLSKLQNQIDDLETRFNKSQKTTTTTTTQSWMRYKNWIPATTTQSPAEACNAAGNFICYNDTSACVNATKLCDGVFDCADESDECFCKMDAPEHIVQMNECPHGYVGSKFLQRCYLFNTNPVSWIEALIDCTKRSANLVDIESRLEQEAIARFAKTKDDLVNASIWLGATNMLRVQLYPIWSSLKANYNEQWKWIGSDKQLNDTGYANWIGAPKQQPDNTMNIENCLEMRADFQWQWNDKDCQTRNPYICEMAMPQAQPHFQPEADEVVEDESAF